MAPLRENMVLYSFGVKGGSRHSSIEKGTGWFGRLVTAGTRSLIAVKALGVIQYMRSKSILGVDAKDYMRDLTADAFRTMMADGAVEVFHVTTGPGDFMWIPPGIVVLETVMEKIASGCALVVYARRTRTTSRSSTRGRTHQRPQTAMRASSSLSRSPRQRLARAEQPEVCHGVTGPTCIVG